MLLTRGLAGIKGVQPERKAFCAMEIEGQTNKVLCTNYVSQKNPVWTNKAEFQTKQPLPTVRICLRIESNNPLYLEGRPIGEVSKIGLQYFLSAELTSLQSLVVIYVKMLYHDL
jgi:hypothetical protein